MLFIDNKVLGGQYFCELSFLLNLNCTAPDGSPAYTNTSDYGRKHSSTQEKERHEIQCLFNIIDKARHMRHNKSRSLSYRVLWLNLGIIPVSFSANLIGRSILGLALSKHQAFLLFF